MRLGLAMLGCNGQQMENHPSRSSELRVNWLSQLPADASIPVVLRSGMRVLPLWWTHRGSFQNDSLPHMDLRIMRCHLSVLAWSHFKTPELATKCIVAQMQVIEVTNAIQKSGSTDVEIARLAANPVFRNASLHQAVDGHDFLYKAMVKAVNAIEHIDRDDDSLWSEAIEDHRKFGLGHETMAESLWNSHIPDWFT